MKISSDVNKYENEWILKCQNHEIFSEKDFIKLASVRPYEKRDWVTWDLVQNLEHSNFENKTPNDIKFLRAILTAELMTSQIKYQIKRINLDPQLNDDFYQDIVLKIYETYDSFDRTKGNEPIFFHYKILGVADQYQYQETRKEKILKKSKKILETQPSQRNYEIKLPTKKYFEMIHSPAEAAVFKLFLGGVENFPYPGQTKNNDFKRTKELKAEPQNFEIKEATLLSTKEYEIYKRKIPKMTMWWLRSAGRTADSAAYVDFKGHVPYYGKNVAVDLCVRPALIIQNLSSSGLEVSDKFKLGGLTFTIIDDNMALCDASIGRCPFRKDQKSKDANYYEMSDVKKFVDKWFEKAKEQFEQIERNEEEYEEYYEEY